MTIGLLQYLATWSTFCKQENSSLWKNDASSKLKEHIKIRWPVNLQLCNYLKSSVYNVCRKLEGFLWEKLLLSPSQGCVDAASIGYGICNANQAVTATKTAKTTTTIGLISKKKKQKKTKQLCTCSTLCLYISLPLFCKTTTWNFRKLPSYTFYGGNFVCGPVHIFSPPLFLTLVDASISHFLTAAVKFSSCSSNKIGLLCFFIPGSSFFSVIHANVDFKIKSKERIGFVVVVFYL